MRSLEGQLLVALESAPDPNCPHRDLCCAQVGDGLEASGVIMNRPVDEPVLVFGAQKEGPLCIGQRQLYIGGPLMGPLMAVHTNELLAEAEILPKLYFTAREHNVFALLQQAEHPYKIFAGHMGWGPDELERQLEKTVWRTTPADRRLRLCDRAKQLWEDVSWHIQEETMQTMFHTRTRCPKNPLVN